MYANLPGRWEREELEDEVAVKVLMFDDVVEKGKRGVETGDFFARPRRGMEIA